MSEIHPIFRISGIWLGSPLPKAGPLDPEGRLPPHRFPPKTLLRGKSGSRIASHSEEAIAIGFSSLDFEAEKGAKDGPLSLDLEGRDLRVPSL
jgi:hypothetical protein